MAYNNPTPEVLALIDLSPHGDVIDGNWYRHVKGKTGNTHHLAVAILGDIVWWYRPVIVRDEITGAIKGYQKKFKGHKLQRSLKHLEEKFGASRQQVRSALDVLVHNQLIDIELATVRLESGAIANNVRFIGINSARIIEISDPMLKATEGYVISNRGVCYQQQTNTEISDRDIKTKNSNTDKSLPDGRALQVSDASLLETQEDDPQDNQSSVVVQNETSAKHTKSDQDPVKEKCSANLPKKKKDDFEYDDYGYVRLPCKGKNGRVGTLALKVMQLVCMAQGIGLNAGKLDGRVYIQGYMDDEWYLEDDWFKAFPFRAMRNDAETIASRFDFSEDWFNQEAIAWYEYLKKQNLPRGKFSVLEFVLKYSDDIKDEQIEWHPLMRTAA